MSRSNINDTLREDERQNNKYAPNKMRAGGKMERQRTWSAAILIALEAFPKGATANEVWPYIHENGLYIPSPTAQTPLSTVQAQLGDFVRNGDERVRRIKKDKVYVYYLSKYSEGVNEVIESSEKKPEQSKAQKESYKERSLHLLLSTYLRHKEVLAKTIFHESSKANDEHQTWVHPDMVGVKFAKFGNKAVSDLYEQLNSRQMAELYSYELKREINNDYELKKYYFQAVSNSTWANYGYLVAFEIGDNLREEIERLNAAFGIGVIKLHANPYESKELYPVKRNELDFRTLDKLCKINKDLETLVTRVGKVLTASNDLRRDVLDGLERICDGILRTDDDVQAYCKENHIPYEEQAE